MDKPSPPEKASKSQLSRRARQGFTTRRPNIGPPTFQRVHRTASYEAPPDITSLYLQDGSSEMEKSDMASRVITLSLNLICSPSTTESCTDDSRLYHPSSVISSHTTSCIRLFQQLLNSEVLGDFEHKVPLSRWRDELCDFFVSSVPIRAYT